MTDLLSNKYALHLSDLHLVCHLLQWLWAGGGDLGEECGAREKQVDRLNLIGCWMVTV
jgi:hypothetical protein